MVGLKKPWRKVLYENQGYPDNYTDKTFLIDLRRNIDIKTVKLIDAIQGTFGFVQEICIVLIFVLTYVYLYNNWMQPDTIMFKSSATTLVCFVIYRVLCSKGIREVLGNDLRTVLIFLVFGHLFSPVLHTLTDTISTNTIYTMTFLMMFIHLIFADYAVPAAIVSNCLSLSAAIFGSVCLASRLPSAYHAFVLLTVSIECFVLFPFVRLKLSKKCSFTFLLILFVSTVLAFISTSLTLLFISGIIFVSIICPLLFIRCQIYKDNIYGPWDEAIINDADSIKE